MNTHHLRSRYQKGFTVLELLVVLVIIGLLLAVVLASLAKAKDKAADASVKNTLSQIAVNVEKQEIAPGVVDYQKAFTATDTINIVKGLATELHVADDAYQYEVSGTEYVIVFPLRSGKYWCVDSHRTVGEVLGLVPNGGMSCADATGRITGDGTGKDTDGDAQKKEADKKKLEDDTERRLQEEPTYQ